jgi:23S rRNA pseudouridine1911/1915/1917 synthase
MPSDDDADAVKSAPPPDADPIDAPITEGDDAEASDDVQLRHFQWRIGKDLVRRLDQYLVDRVGYLSRNEIQKLITEGFVTVNGRKIKPSYHPRENDQVVMTAPPPRSQTIGPEPIPIDILYEDQHMLALNKQTNLIVHPARGIWSGTLVNALVHYGNVHGQTWSTVNGAWRPGILHRLDRNTTGVMLVAKSDEAHWRLSRQFENRTIQKTYLAVVHGLPEMTADVIDLPIGHDRFIREKMAVRRLESGAKSAVTQYEVIEQIPVVPGRYRVADADPVSPMSLVRLSPKTGRTHQLRVHMSHIGYPIVGDVMYGGRVVSASDGSFKFDRQALHAFEITFVHPVTLQTQTIRAPLRDDIKQLYELLKPGGVPTDIA